MGGGGLGDLDVMPDMFDVMTFDVYDAIGEPVVEVEVIYGDGVFEYTEE
ncbi:MAG: hypothetical protein QXU93_11725 [Thermoproteus sp.]